MPYRAASLAPDPRATAIDGPTPLIAHPEPDPPARLPLRVLDSPDKQSEEHASECHEHGPPASTHCQAPDHEAHRRTHRARKAAAIALLALIGMRRDLVGSISIGDLAALAAIPVSWSAVRHEYRFSPLLLLSTLAAMTGLVLSWLVEPPFQVSASLQRSMVMSLLALPWAVAGFMWAARHLGTRLAVLGLGGGMLVESLHLLGTSDNPWKAGIGLPFSIVALAAVNDRGRRLQLLVLAALCATFLLTDARSSLAYLTIILGIVLWQSTASWLRWRPPEPRALAIAQALMLGAIGVAAIIGVLVVSASGSLGEDAQERTIAQYSGTSGFLLNARPELGASWALLNSRPWGYGAGVLPRYEDIQVAKGGMAALGYDPSNGYVENFMFGNGFELHSALVNVWVAASLPGAALMALITGLTLMTLLRNLGGLRITPWMFLVGMVVLQNIFVGPWTVLPPYLPFILGSWILMPSLRELNRHWRAERTAR